MSTPSAAAVNDAVVGFDRLKQVTNGGTLVIEKSMIVDAGLFSIITVPGVGTSALGAVPKLHISCAVLTTGAAISPTDYCSGSLCETWVMPSQTSGARA